MKQTKQISLRDEARIKRRIDTLHRSFAMEMRVHNPSQTPDNRDAGGGDGSVVDVVDRVAVVATFVVAILISVTFVVTQPYGSTQAMPVRAVVRVPANVGAPMANLHRLAPTFKTRGG